MLVHFYSSVLLCYVPLNIAMYSIVYLCGIVVYAHYDKVGCDPLKTGQITSANQVLADTNQILFAISCTMNN